MSTTRSPESNRDAVMRLIEAQQPPAAPEGVHDDGPSGWTHRWWWRVRRPDRKGQPCRVLVRGGRGSILVEFPDGERVVTSRHAVRRASDR